MEKSNEKKECPMCLELEPGDTLYKSSDWDGGLGFDYINDIQYCPICGTKLIEWRERLAMRKKEQKDG